MTVCFVKTESVLKIIEKKKLLAVEASNLTINELCEMEEEIRTRKTGEFLIYIVEGKQLDKLLNTNENGGYSYITYEGLIQSDFVGRKTFNFNDLLKPSTISGNQERFDL